MRIGVAGDAEDEGFEFGGEGFEEGGEGGGVSFGDLIKKMGKMGLIHL
jgi:hypothetical protein